MAGHPSLSGACRALLLGVLVASVAGCVRLEWERDRRFEPPPEGALERLQPGQTDLSAALEALGAPLWVWELDGDGAALAYGWSDDQFEGGRVSLPTDRRVSPSLELQEVDTRMRGLVLFFDADWTLVAWNEGLLMDLTQDPPRRRPAEVAADEAEDPALPASDDR